jgi:hypothetical protein
MWNPGPLIGISTTPAPQPVQPPPSSPPPPSPRSPPVLPPNGVNPVHWPVASTQSTSYSVTKGQSPRPSAEPSLLRPTLRAPRRSPATQNCALRIVEICPETQPVCYQFIIWNNVNLIISILPTTGVADLLAVLCQVLASTVKHSQEKSNGDYDRNTLVAVMSSNSLPDKIDTGLKEHVITIIIPRERRFIHVAQTSGEIANARDLASN